MRTVVCISLISLFFVGCSTHLTDPKINMKPPTYVEQLPPRTRQQAVTNPGSIFGRGDNPLFSDLKAMNQNDIVTVVITENTAQSSTGAKTLSKNDTNALGAGVTTGIGGSLVSKAGKIGFNSTSNTSFSGSGSSTRNESFVTTISARIIKILNNGNYFIEGSRELLVNGEKQIIQISGVIRPYDIDQTNTIASKYIADAKILYKTEGALKRTTQKPWGSKFINSIWPF